MDYSEPCITLKKLLTQYYEATNRKQFTLAYEISVDIAEIAEQLEQIAMENANASNA